MNKWVAAAAVTIAALGLAGCSSGSAEPKKPVNVSYDSVAELKAAFVKAGGDCDDWNQDNVVRGAAESGTCGDDTTLSTYLSTESRDTVVSNVKSLGAGVIDVSMLVGKNWIVNSPAAPDVKGKLGGTMVSTSSEG